MAQTLTPEMADVEKALGRPLDADILERLQGGMTQAEIGVHYGRLMGRGPYHESTISRWRKDLGIERRVVVDRALGASA